MTKKSILRKISTVKSKDVRLELGRAHAMIALLSLSLISILLAGSLNQVEFQPLLTTIAIVLLAFVSIFSFVVAFRFRK